MNTLKTLSSTKDELRVGNYLVLFGGSDLAGEFFTKNTHFESSYTDLGVLYEDFEHGMDAEDGGNDENNVLGIADWKSAKVDDNGIFVERVLNRRAEYMQWLAQLIDMGVMGSSSAAIPGKTRRKSSGEIVEWPLMRDSLTVTPMEPRMVTTNILTAAKALAEAFPHSKSLSALSKRAVASRTNIEDFASLGDMESYLRDAGGLSRREAKAFLSKLKTLGRRDADEVGMQQIVEALKRRSEKSLGQRDADEGMQAIAAALKRRGAALAG
jgi:hypothetical protein